ncbi:MAG: T9SS type A sorting domain-containing protein [Lentimicrobiaceae bacterium]|nr:T9SS type A sorting domain-containing protein [Lentimicrobiaceae bacterium]
MKKVIFAVFLLCSSLLKNGTVHAQEAYHPFIEGNKHWDEVYYGQKPVSAPCSSVSQTDGYRYFFEGDTIIQGIVYQILRAHLVVSLSPDGYYCPPFAVDESRSYIKAFMREDVEKQQVFHYIDEREEILYDFSLQEGDFLDCYDIGGYKRLEVTLVDSVELLNGEKRKRLLLAYGGYSEFYHIEGIGNIFGPTYTAYGVVDYDVFLKCFVQDNEFLYNGGWEGTTCFEVLNTNENTVQKKIRVYPNPAKSDGQLTLVCNQPLKNIAIYDLRGALVQTIEIADLNFQQIHHITLNANKLTVGIYILQVQTTKNQIHHEKVILY